MRGEREAGSEVGVQVRHKTALTLEKMRGLWSILVRAVTRTGWGH